MNVSIHIILKMPPDRLCRNCGKEFTPYEHTQYHCNKICAREYGVKRQRDYSKKLREKTKQAKILSFIETYGKEAWKFLNEISKQQQKITIKKKDYCEACKSSDEETRLVIHHISYSPIKIVTLCDRCHVTLHTSILKRKKCKYDIVIDNSDIRITTELLNNNSS